MIMIMIMIKIGRRAIIMIKVAAIPIIMIKVAAIPIIMTTIIKSEKEDESPIFQKFSKVKTASLSLSIISFILKKSNKK